jgi:hypothetical protein
MVVNPNQGMFFAAVLSHIGKGHAVVFSLSLSVKHHTRGRCFGLNLDRPHGLTPVISEEEEMKKTAMSYTLQYSMVFQQNIL